MMVAWSCQCSGCEQHTSYEATWYQVTNYRYQWTTQKAEQRTTMVAAKAQPQDISYQPLI